MHSHAHHRLSLTAAAALTAVVALTPIAADAATAYLVVGGWSRHFAAASTRQWLNQNQATRGGEIDIGRWSYQLTTMTDSFGCRSWEAGAAHQWPLWRAGPVSGGVMLGAMAAWRCTAWGTTQIRVTTPGTMDVSRPDIAAWHWHRSAGSADYDYHLWLHASHDYAPRGWVVGVIPAAYVDLWRVRAELALVRSTWSGRWLAYAQVSLRVATW